jgi:hypothetical protein
MLFNPLLENLATGCSRVDISSIMLLMTYGIPIIVILSLCATITDFRIRNGIYICCCFEEVTEMVCMSAILGGQLAGPHPHRDVKSKLPIALPESKFRHLFSLKAWI